MAEPTHVTLVGVALLNDKDQVLMQKRIGTKIRNNTYSVPGGHVDAGEDIVTAACRELKEELGVTTLPADLELAWIYDGPCDAESVYAPRYLEFYFVCRRWAGEPQNMEPRKHTDPEWFDLAGLPDNMHPQSEGFFKHFKTNTAPVLAIGY